MDRTESLTSDLLERCTFPPAGSSVICAVSGGADSLALLVLARAAGCEVTAVHVDHGLRAGSAGEAAVVDAAAVQLGASFRAERVEVGEGSDLEARARAARHEALGPDVMTGHTLDDQAETLLINLMRGAGAQGLSAMRPGVRHPILALRRSETEALCEAFGLDPVEDPSNSDPRFVRNRVRHELLPLFDDIAARDVRPLIARATDHLRSAQHLVGLASGGVDPTNVRELRGVDPALAREALRRWLRVGGYAPSTADLDRVWSVVTHEAIACEVSGGRRVGRTAGVLSVRPIDGPPASSTIQ